MGIPGVGLFQLVHVPARMDYAAKMVYSPLPTVRFTQKTTGADKNFFRYVSNELNVQEWELIRRFHDFTYKLKNDLNVKPGVDLPGLGVLVKNKLGEISFEPTHALDDYFPSRSIAHIYQEEAIAAAQEIGGESVSATENTAAAGDLELQEAKTKWWIMALIMAIVAIAAIVYYYLTNNSSF